MPEAAEEQQQEQQPRPPQRGRLAELMVLAIVMVVEAIIIVLVMSRPRVEEATAGEAEAVSVTTPSRPEEELLAPEVVIEGFPTSVRVDEAGSRTRTLIMGVTLKIGHVVEGKQEKKLDLKYLENVYKPKVERLIPRIKDLLIRETSSRTYSELLDLSVKQQILENIKRRANETLKAYGVEPRIVEVYWNIFHFN